MGFWSKLFWGVNDFSELDKEQDISVQKSAFGNSFFMGNYGTSQAVEVNDVLNDPYTYHHLINSMSRVITTQVCKVPLYLTKKGSDDKIENHPIIDLLREPNPLIDGQEFIEKIVLGLLLNSGKNIKDTGGQVFIIGKKRGEYVDFGKGEIPDTLNVLYEKDSGYEIKARVVNNAFEGWEYVFNGAVVKIFSPSEVIRIRFVNPSSDLKGLSWVTPALLKMTLDIHADNYNSSFLENDATPNGLLTAKVDGLTDGQMKQALVNWNDQHKGSSKHGKLAALPYQMEYKPLGINHRDMEFSEQKKTVKGEMISVFGLNKIAVGEYESVNYATIKYGHKILWNDTYLPILRKIVNTINNRWIQHIPEGLELKYDISGIESLQQEYSEKAQAYSLFVNNGIPPVMAFRLLNIPVTEQELENYPWFNEQLVKSSMALPTEESPADKEEAQQGKALTKSLTLDEQYKFTKGYYEAVTKNNEETFAKFVQKMLTQQEKEMLDKLHVLYGNEKGFINKAISKSDIDKILFDKKFWNKQVKSFYEKYIPRVMRAEKAQLLKETNNLVNWKYTDETIKKFVDKRKAILTSITETTFDKVKDDLYKKIDAGLYENMTVQDMVKDIESTIGDSIKARGGNIETIARTEATSVQSLSRVDAYEQNNIEWVEWSAFEDEHTRETHLQNSNAGAVKLGEAFPGNGLRFPHDPKGPPEEVINCRCVLIASEKNLE